MPSSSYQRQQARILVIFMAIGVLPAVLLTIIPRALFDVVFLPFPLAISLLGFIPAGYFYVIYRRGLLGLDIIFSQTAVFMVLALLMLLVYGTGLFMLQNQFDFDDRAITPATLLFLPMLLFTLYASRPVQHKIQGIFFGEVIHNQSIPLFASALSSNPETATLQSMVEHVAGDLQARQAVLVLKNRLGRLTPMAQIRVVISKQIQHLEGFSQPLLRSVHQESYPNPLFQIHDWAEILVPIVVRGDQIGYLALSRPAPDGYYNLEQVAFLSRVADIIAVGSEAISLFEASRNLSLQLLSSREDERREIASEIHDGPIQGLILVTQHLRDLVHGFSLEPKISEQLAEKATRLQTAIVQLREICAGLYPPFIDQGVKFIAETLTREFSEEHGLNIQLTVPIHDDVMVSAKVSRVLYHVLLESLTNIVKHAHTQDVCVELDYTDDLIFLSIADQGVGCVVTRYSVSELIRSWHIGIVGMVEWAESVNGSLSVQQNEPRGTKVILQVPLPR
jgi:signal transduction histidine kinase